MKPWELMLTRSFAGRGPRADPPRVEVDERHEPAWLAPDDRERERQAEPPRADHRLGMTADRDPDRQRILNRARKHRQIHDRRAVLAAPGDALALRESSEGASSFSSKRSS